MIDDSLGEPWCATLAAHLGHGIAGEEGELRASRRYAVAHRLAGLYSSYARQRVDLVRAWRLGDDTDGLEPLPDDLAWQAELWRRLVSRVGEPPPDVRHEQTLAALAAGGTGLDLPGRLSLFGHTRLPATEVELLGALGEHRDVHLWLPQASAALWADLAGPSSEGPVPRDDDRSSTYAGHPLLASLGRDARELQRSLAVLPGAVDAPSLGAVPAGDDLLGHLQADIRANHAPTPLELSGRALAEDDRSVQVHACHGPARQVEVLREVLVGLLQDDPTLEPRDIVVMCPDVETYAPLDRGRLRSRRRGPRRCRGRRSPRSPPPGAAGRPRAEQHQPPVRGRPVAREPRGRAGAGQRGARPDRARRLPPTVRAGRRRPHPGRRVGVASPACGGVSTAGSARASRWRGSARTPGGPGSTGC